MEQDTSALRVGRALAWLAVLASVVTPYLILHFGGLNASTVGYEGADHLLAEIVVVVLAIALTRRESARTRTLALFGAASICMLLGGWSSIDAFESVAVNREIAAARPLIDRLRKIAHTESARLASGSTEVPSPEVHALLEQAPPDVPDLSDVRRPLRERLQELARKQSLATVQLQREFIHRLDAARDAGALDFENLVDARRREASLAKLASQRETLDWWYGQAHVSSTQYEADIERLGMPAKSRDEMLRGARRAQDNAYPQLKAIVDHSKAIIAAEEKAIRFAASHVTSMHRNADSIVFDNPRDTAEFNEILQQAK